MGTLYLVATPIGNLEDISARALRILAEVRLIAAEDTRHTGKLLSHFQIHTPQVSYHEHNKLSKMEPVLRALDEGDVALASDAGTPALNDPGYELVRAALAAGHTVTPIPGPSAPLAALVASGLPTDAFIYLGYLPRKASDRRKFIARAADQPYTLIFLETPHRLVDALADLLDGLGDRPCAVARELTKLHEEIRRENLSQALAHFTANPPRGEITLVVAGAAYERAAAPATAPAWTDETLAAELRRRMEAGESASRAAAALAAETGRSRRELYRIILELSSEIKADPQLTS
jgi:16S rRNA (cytidine1402-2'-O)-methyltransferase